jgi:hypothetical protein
MLVRVVELQHLKEIRVLRLQQALMKRMEKLLLQQLLLPLKEKVLVARKRLRQPRQGLRMPTLQLIIHQIVVKAHQKKMERDDQLLSSPRIGQMAR